MQTSLADLESSETLEKAGFRFGDKGTHTSRTMMLTELLELFAAVPCDAARGAYTEAIVEENVLGKQTAATRRLTDQRLGELYCLDLRFPVFRVLRRVWDVDPVGRPLIALLCSLARDPLFRSTGDLVMDLPVRTELIRATLLDAIRQAVGSRLNESILDKVARNVGSSWTQSGHLEGRVRKMRQRVTPTPGSVAFALWMGALEGLAGEQLLLCRWARVLDRAGGQLIELVLQAKQKGLLHARIGGGVVEIDATKLDAVVAGI